MSKVCDICKQVITNEPGILADGGHYLHQRCYQHAMNKGLWLRHLLAGYRVIIALCVALVLIGIFLAWLLDSFGDSAGWAIVMIGYALLFAAGFVFYRKAKTTKRRRRGRHYRDYSVGGAYGGDGGGGDGGGGGE